MSESATSATLLSITSVVSAFNAMLPPFADIRKTHGDPGMVTDVRVGEVAAFTLTTAIGLTASSLSGSPIPAMVAIMAAVVLVALYETTLHHNPERNVTNVPQLRIL